MCSAECCDAPASSPSACAPRLRPRDAPGKRSGFFCNLGTTSARAACPRRRLFLLIARAYSEGEGARLSRCWCRQVGEASSLSGMRYAPFVPAPSVFPSLSAFLPIAGSFGWVTAAVAHFRLLFHARRCLLKKRKERRERLFGKVNPCRSWPQCCAVVECFHVHHETFTDRCTSGIKKKKGFQWDTVGCITIDCTRIVGRAEIGSVKEECASTVR